MRSLTTQVFTLLLALNSTSLILGAEESESPPLKNKTAIEASKQYETEVAAARNAFITKLKTVVKEEGAQEAQAHAQIARTTSDAGTTR